MLYRDIHTALYDATVLAVAGIGYYIPPAYTPPIAVLEKLESSGFWAMLGVLIIFGRYLVAIEQRLTESKKTQEHLAKRIDEYFEAKSKDSGDMWTEITKTRDNVNDLRVRMATHENQPTNPGPRNKRPGQ